MGDRVIWVVYFFLCAVSLVEVFSAASSLAYKSGSFWLPMMRHAAFLACGTVVLWVVHTQPCRKFKLLFVLLYPTSMFMLLWMLIFGDSVNNAARWMGWGWFRFQPSELAKMALVGCTALILSRTQRERGADPQAFKYILISAAIICLLILPENLSTAFLLGGVVFLMMFIGRVSLLQLGKLLGVIVLAGGMIVGIAFAAHKTGYGEKLSNLPGFHRLETWIERMESHGNDIDLSKPGDYDIDENAQVAHAHIAIASSGGIGKMPGNSVERDFLSQAFSDFIYAIIIEEIGLWGGGFVVFLYIVILYRVGRIASRCERNFPPFLAIGLALLLVSQALLNMLVAVGLFPVTGQPLPLISRGGTSTIINCIYIGMILSVSRYARQTEHPESTRFDGPMDAIKHEDDLV